MKWMGRGIVILEERGGQGMRKCDFFKGGGTRR